MATGELPEEGKACLGATFAELPPAGLRFVQGALTPDRMLDAISEGADLLDATYALAVSKPCSQRLQTKPGITRASDLDVPPLQYSGKGFKEF